jgi:3-oxoacyl-[acyl-carrier-protein] synthase-3
MRVDPDGSLLDLLLPAAREALDGTDPGTVRWLIYTHATQEVTPSTMDAARMLADALGLPDAEAFALTQQNCAPGWPRWTPPAPCSPAVPTRWRGRWW